MAGILPAVGPHTEGRSCACADRWATGQACVYGYMISITPLQESISLTSCSTWVTCSHL